MGFFRFLSEYLCHVYVRNDNLAAVVIADTEYPQRVCFTLLDKVWGKITTSIITRPSFLLATFQLINAGPVFLRY